MFRVRQFGTALALGGALAISWASAASGARVRFDAPIKLASAAAGTEPRIVVGADRRMWIITNHAETGRAVVYGSKDGILWERTRGDLPGQTSPSLDNDLAVTPSGRLISVESDGLGLTPVTGYSENRGRSWSSSSATELVDQNRAWLAVGPVDPATHEPQVYLLSHNLVTGQAQHNMWVSISADGGQSFGAPVALTLPGSQAYVDLQCSSASAPSGIAVDQTTGRVYASFATRTSSLGGCGASVFSSPEPTLAGETRVWVATSPDGSAGSWETTVAADATPNMVNAAIEPITVDPAGHVYVAYAETAHPYPDFSRASVKYVWSPPGGRTWSRPVTVAPGGRVGRYDPSIVAAGRGNLALAYYTGTPRQQGEPLWYVDVALVRDAESRSPHVTTTRVSDIPAYAATANGMAGSCSTGPAAGVVNGQLCGRASENWGLALDPRCRLVVVFPTVKNDGEGSDPGTFVATQSDGPTVCKQEAANGALRLVTGKVQRRGRSGLAVRVRALGGTARGLTATLSRKVGGRHVTVARGTARSAGRHGTRISLRPVGRRRVGPGRYRLVVTARDLQRRTVRTIRTAILR